MSSKMARGKASVSGSPPASEMTSACSVIAMRSRMADDIVPEASDEKRESYRAASAGPTSGVWDFIVTS